VSAPLISFENPQQLRQALATHIPLTDDETSHFELLVSRNLPPVVSAAALGAILGVNPKLLTAMARFAPRYYRVFAVKKRSGGTRQIVAPRTFLKTVQLYILKNILSRMELPSHVTGFVRGRGTVVNATIHQGAVYLLNVDIEDFFGSVGEKSVREFFLELGYSSDIARLFMQLCTYGGSLPQGAPTSPSLANHTFVPIDNEILELCAPRNLKYSRYADDLTFSAAEPFRKDFVRKLRSLLRRHGFRLNVKKTRLSRPGQAKYVTGLLVNERVQAPRELRRRLRAMFHRADRSPRSFSRESHRLLGWASFVNSYDASLGKKYLKIARKVIRKSRD